MAVNPLIKRFSSDYQDDEERKKQEKLLEKNGGLDISSENPYKNQVMYDNTIYDKTDNINPLIKKFGTKTDLKDLIPATPYVQPKKNETTGNFLTNSFANIFQSSNTPISNMNNQSKTDSVKFGPYTGTWGNEFNNDGGIRRQLFKMDNGDTRFLDPQGTFTRWQDSPTFDDEIQAYKDAYIKANGAKGYQSNYEDDSHYPDWVYDIMAQNNFDAAKLKEWFNNSPEGTQWKQDSIPTAERQKTVFKPSSFRNGYDDRTPEQRLQDNLLESKTKAGAFGQGFANSALLGIPAAFGGDAAQQTNQSALENHKNMYKLGEFAGYAIPGEGILKAASPITKGIENKLMKSIVQGGIVGGGIAGSEDLLSNGANYLQGNDTKSIGDIGKDVALNAAFGGAGGALFHGLGNVIKSAFPKWETTFESTAPETTPIKKEPMQGKFTVKNTELEKVQQNYDDAIQAIHNRFGHWQLIPEEIPLIKSELGIDLPKLVDNLQTAKTNVSQIGERQRMGLVSGVNDIPVNKLQVPKFNKSLNNTEIPNITGNTPNIPVNPMNLKPGESVNLSELLNQSNKVEPNVSNIAEVQGIGKLKNNKFQNTVADSPLTNPELSTEIKNNQLNYNPITNEDTIVQAQKIINADPIKAKEWVMSDGSGNATQFTTAQLLVRQAQKEGRYSDAIEMIQKVSEKATKQGQSIQALSLWNRLTPEGMLKFANQTIEKANSKLPQNKQIKLTPEFAQDITNRMNEIAKFPEGTEKNMQTQVVLKDIANQVPTSIWKKIDTLQTMAQLLNPKTSIRNVLGNAGMMLNENISNTLGAGIDKGLSLITKKRTVGLPNLLEQAKGYKEGAIRSINDVKNGVSLNNTQYDLPNNQVFSDKNVVGKALNSGQEVLDYMLKVPDEAAKTAIKNDSLRSQMKLAGVTTPTDEMIQIAENDAKYGTFQDNNKVSDAFASLKKVLNLNQDFGLGSLVLKYPKTPANILMRAIDYSPVSFYKSVYRLAEPLINGGEFNQRKFVQETSRALVGTGNLIGTGYILSKLGIITGKQDDDIDTAAMQKMSGLGAYKLNIDALKRFVASGFDPSNAKVQKGDNLINYDWFQPSSIGIAIGANAADNKKTSGIDVLSSVVDSINSGINTLSQQPLISGLTRALGQRDASKAITETIKGIPASMVPTVLKQVAQLMDNTTRNTYDPSWVEQGKNMVKSKIPVLSQDLQPKLDTFGQPQKAYENNSIANVLFNPAFTSTYQPNEAAQLPLDIFNQTGDKTAMPRQTPNYIMNKGQKIQLTPQENKDYQEFVGQKTEKVLNLLSNLPVNKATIKSIQKDLTKINEEGRNMILKNRGLK